MRKSHLVFVVVVVFLSFSTCFVRRAEAQTAQDLNGQAQWMNAWVGWMNNAGQHNPQVEMTEATAKLVDADARRIKAVSDANKTNAETLEILEEVRTKRLNNRVLVAETFWERKRVYAENKPKRKPILGAPRYSSASLLTLTEKDIDSLWRLTWPPILSGEEFSEDRKAIDVLFAKFLSNREDVSLEIREIADKMLGVLKERMPKVSKDPKDPKDPKVPKVPMYKYAGAIGFFRRTVNTSRGPNAPESAGEGDFRLAANRAKTWR